MLNIFSDEVRPDPFAHLRADANRFARALPGRSLLRRPHLYPGIPYGLLNRKNWLGPEMELVTTHWLPTSEGCGLTVFQETPGPRVAAAWSESPAELLVGQLTIT